MTDPQPKPDPQPTPKPTSKPGAGSVPSAGPSPNAAKDTAPNTGKDAAKPAAPPAVAAPKPGPAPAQNPAPSRPATPPASPPPARRGAAPVLTALGFILLAGGLAWVWTEQQRLAAGSDPARIGALEAQLQGMSQRLSRLEQRPVADLRSLDARLTALEQRPPVDLKPLEARIAALEQRPAAPAVSPALEGQVTALQQRLAQAEQAQAGTAARAARLARLQAATAALDAGQPLGAIAGAPPALTRFATTPPPTEASLRLAFDAAAARAAKASRPGNPTDSLGQRMWMQVQSLVTVRQGDRVLSGAPATVVLGKAREQLTAGNLAGALAALDHLDKPAAAAMADWTGPAHALLDARAALAKLTAAE